MYRKLLFITLFAVLVIDCQAMSRLAETPRPQPRFKLNRYLGNWYVHGLSMLDSWKGAWSFSDYTSRYEWHPNKNIVLRHSWRKNKCASAAHQFIPNGKVPGMFTLIDNIGGMITGTSVVVATDYITFAVKWGCLTPIPCKAPYVVIKTRQRFPNPKTWKTIQRILFNNWGMTMIDIKVYDQNRPCPVGPFPKNVCKPGTWWRGI